MNEQELQDNPTGHIVDVRWMPVMLTDEREKTEAEQRFMRDVEAFVFHTSFIRARQVELNEGIITKEDAEAQLKEHNEWWEKRQKEHRVI